jgi:hypothetical protein
MTACQEQALLLFLFLEIEERLLLYLLVDPLLFNMLETLWLDVPLPSNVTPTKSLKKPNRSRLPDGNAFWVPVSVGTRQMC